MTRVLTLGRTLPELDEQETHADEGGSVSMVPVGLTLDTAATLCSDCAAASAMSADTVMVVQCTVTALC